MNPETGEATEIAPVTNADTGEPITLLIACAIDGKGQMYGYDISTDLFMEIDKQTGEASILGPIGFNANFGQGMDYDLQTGTMYMTACRGEGSSCVGELRTVDLETGATELVGVLGTGDQLGYLALPSGGLVFIDTDLRSGTLEPNGEVAIPLEYDARGIREGTYQAQAIVISDVSGRPESSVQTTLEILADPAVTLQPEGLEFGDVFAGGSTTRQITLVNSGLDDLNVSGIEVTPKVFTLPDSAETSFTLAPGEARAYTVTFEPEAAQSYEGSFTVASDAPGGGATATLAGEGIPAPAIAASPESFDLQAYAGQTYERTLEIANEGNNPLEYAITPDLVSESDRGPGLNAFTDFVLQEDFNEGIPDTWTVVDNINEGVTWKLNTGYNVDNWTGGDGTAAAAFSYRFPDDPYDTELRTPKFTATTTDLTLEFKGNYFNLGKPDTLDVDITTDGGQTWKNVLRWTEDHGNLFSPPGELVQVSLASHLGEGDEFQLRWRYYLSEPNITGWYAQIDDVVISRELEFLTIDPPAGTIAPGASEDVTLGIDAMGLTEGTYEVNLEVASNDPAQPTVDVPLTLEVIESLTVSPGADSTLVHPNEEFLLPIIVDEDLGGFGVQSYQFTLTYAAPLIEALGVETEGTLSEDAQVTANVEEGQIHVAAAEAGEGGNAPTLFNIEGEGTLVFVHLKAKEELGASDLAFTNFQFNEGEPPASTETGHVTVEPLYGDVSLNLEVSAFDAAQALQYTVGALELGETAIVSGDVSGNGELSAFDAARILDFAVGNIDCFPEVEECEDGDAPAVAMKQKGAQSAPSATLGWGEVTRSKAQSTDAASTSGADAAKAETGGSLVDLPLTLREAEGPVRALTLTTRIDPQAATLEGVRATGLPDGWQMVHHATDKGVVKIALAGSTPLTGDRNLAMLELRWLDEEAQLEIGGESVVNEAGAVQVEAASITPIPEQFALKGNYPNPFGQVTEIALDLPERAEVRVEVYDVLGRRVMVAQDGEMPAGTNQTVRIDGRRLASGLYLYRVIAEVEGERQVDTGRMTLVR